MVLMDWGKLWLLGKKKLLYFIALQQWGTRRRCWKEREDGKGQLKGSIVQQGVANVDEIEWNFHLKIFRNYFQAYFNSLCSLM